MSADIPTQADFQLPSQRTDDLDAWHAWKSFGGLTLDEAYALFLKNPEFYHEDLENMAAKPFCYYLPVTLRYLQSEESSGESGVVACFVSHVDFQFRCGHDISAAFPCIREICDYVLARYGKFEVTETIYGDLRPQYEELRRRVGGQDVAPNAGPVSAPASPNVADNPSSVN